MCSPVCSVTTPSWDDEAQAESSHPITKASIPHHAACLFTKPNLLIIGPDATRGTRVFTPKKGARKNFARKEKLAFSSVWPATGASLNACGTNTIGGVFFRHKTGSPKKDCSCWKHILM